MHVNMPSDCISVLNNNPWKQLLLHAMTKQPFAQGESSLPIVMEK